MLLFNKNGRQGKEELAHLFLFLHNLNKTPNFHVNVEFSDIR